MSSGLALIFPGQGSQIPGMGADLLREGRVDDLLAVCREKGLELDRLLEVGGPEQLRPTEVAQPALYVVGVGIGRLLVELGLRPQAVAGHSLGEYSAAAVAQVFSPEDGMRLVLERGRLMAAAEQGTMAAVLGMDAEELRTICLEVSEQGRICVLANYNCPGQSVISGSLEGVEQVSTVAKSRGAKRVVPLNVAGAFHSPLMASAGASFEALLAGVTLRDPVIPVALGASGEIANTAEAVRVGLSSQLVSPVRWTQVVLKLSGSGIQRFVECGPSGVLAGLVRRISPGATAAGCATVGEAREMTSSVSPNWVAQAEPTKR